MQRDGFPVEWLQELKDRNNIVEVISRYVPLQQKSNIYWGSCPFHHEKTPSFAVYEDGNYHCYGCGESGDVIKFVMKIESLSFIEAVHYLAERAGMELPNLQNVAQIQQAKKKRDRLFEILNETAKYYHKNLMSNKGKDARKYLENRGIDMPFMVRFGLGYSPGYDDTIDYLKAKKYAEKDIIDSGVGWTSNKGNRVFDALSGRMIVPIIDKMGRVIAFGGRIINSNQKGGKYLNSHNTSIFVKNKAIYGVNYAKREKQKAGIDRVIIVEGYMDVISLAKYGFNNAVAGMGTALGKGQAREIKNLSHNVYVCYDGDSAGKKAAITNLEILNDEGLNLFVVSLPEGLDPDDTLKKYGKEGFEKLLSEALPYVEYRLKIIAESHDLSLATGRARYVKEALDFIKTVGDRTQQEVYLDIIKKQSGVEKNILRDSLSKEVAVTILEPITEPSVTDNSAEQIAARFILNSLLKNAKYAKIDNLTCDMFTDKTHKEIFEYIENEIKNGRKPAMHMLYTIASSDEEAANIANTIVNFKEEARIVKYYNDSVLCLKKKYYMEKISELSQNFDKAIDDEDKKTIMKDLLAFQTKLKKLK